MSTTSILKDFTRTADRRPAAGALADAHSCLHDRSLPVLGGTAKVISCGVSSAADNTDVTLNVGEDLDNLVAITINTGTGATTTTIADALVAAVNAEPLVNGFVRAARVTTACVLYGRQKNKDFVATEESALLSTPATLTAAGGATNVYFGTFVEMASPTAGFVAQGQDYGCQALGEGTYTAGVYVFDVDGAGTLQADDEIRAVLEFDQTAKGYLKAYEFGVQYATSQTATLAALAALFNGVLPENTVAVTSSATALTFTGEIAGLPFRVRVWVLDASADEEVEVTDTGSTDYATPLGGGIVRKAHTREQDSSGNGYYTLGGSPTVLDDGEIWVRLDDSHSFTDLRAGVFVRVTATGDEVAGSFRTTADSGDCLPLSAFGLSGSWKSTNKQGFNGHTVARLRITPMAQLLEP